MDFLKAIKTWIYSKTSRYFSRAVSVEGTLKGTDQPFRCLFVGNGSLMEYLAPKIFAERPHTMRSQRIWIPSLKKYIQNRQEGLDLCIAVIPLQYEPMFKGLYDFRGQEYVRQIIDTSGSWEEIRGRFSKKKRQISNSLTSKSGLDYRISNDPADFDLFYHRMFVPHIRRQYGDLSYIEPYGEMRAFFLNGLLLLVVKGDQVVAGALCLIKDGALIFRRTGVLDGEEGYIKEGAQTALYYFNLLFAKERSLQKVDTMKSRSFVTDGVYRHKSEWGAGVYPDDEADSWVYFFNFGSPERVALFFDRNPVIVDTSTGLKAVVGLENGSELSPGVERDLTNRFYAPGLEGLILLTPKSTTPIEINFQKKP